MLHDSPHLSKRNIHLKDKLWAGGQALKKTAQQSHTMALKSASGNTLEQLLRACKIFPTVRVGYTKTHWHAFLVINRTWKPYVSAVARLQSHPLSPSAPH